MDKKLLIEKYVRVAVRKAIAEAEAQQKRAEKSMYLIYRFPGLKKVMEDLMSPSFGRFVKTVELVAPKPTTFNVKLINDQEFFISYSGRNTYTAKIAGKKYDVQNLSELERASSSIANLLELNYAIAETTAGEEKPPKPDSGAEAFNDAVGGGTTPAIEPPPPTAGEEPAPPPDEPVTEPEPPAEA